MSLPDTCWTVVQQAATGDARARGTFADLYLEVVRAFLASRWRGRKALAHLDDAVQEVFFDFFRKGGALQRFDRNRAPNFRTFLYGVARTVAMRHEQRLGTEARVSGGVESDLDEIQSREASLSRVFDRSWALRILTRAKERQKLNAESQGAAAARRVEILRLRFGESMPIRDIAALWGVATDKLHHEYATAREEFKQALRTEIAWHCAGSPDDIEQECRSLLTLLE